jgi:hypothetical protein
MINSVREHQANANHYKEIYTLFMAYEDSAIEYCSENRMEERIITHPKASELNDKISYTVSMFKNPF